MDDAHALPTDLAECQRLLLAAFQRAAELSRVLDETAASYEELQATHQAALEELSALKRWIYGRRPRSWSREKASGICLISNPPTHNGSTGRADARTAAPISRRTSPSPRTRPRQAAALSARA